jgi:cation diffusion facilitator family transporter
MSKERQVQRVIIIEGLANLVVLLIKLVVGLGTGSFAVLADAAHSLTDLANNVVVWLIVRLSGMPADRKHPYGHRKFETLAVFVLASVLVVIGFELALHTIRREAVEIATGPVELGLMIIVLVINITVAAWQRGWARRLDSTILLADANHTLSDSLITMTVIAGWQLSSYGYLWLDKACALGVSLLIFYLAYSLFRKALPALVDEYAIAPERLNPVILGIDGVRRIRRIRSRWMGAARAVDMVITVDAELSTEQAHAIADSIEDKLYDKHGIRDVSIHIEPESVDAKTGSRPSD